MNAIIAWFAENKVAANLLMVVIVAVGLLTATQTKRETFPPIELDMIGITVPYPGAVPEDIEKSILLPIEGALSDVQGVKSVLAFANDGAASLNIEVDDGFDSKFLLAEIKARIDGLSDFPEEAGRAVVQELSVSSPAAQVIISGPADYSSLSSLANKVRRDLLDHPDISLVKVRNERKREIAIEVTESALQRYGLTFGEVAAVIRQSSLDLPAGVIKTARGSVTLKTQGQSYWGEQFEDVVVRAQPDGGRILLSDVATVIDGHEDSVVNNEFNGHPSVVLQVYRVGNQDLLEVSQAITDYVEKPTSYIPHGIELTVWNDASPYLRGRLELLTTNMLQGLALVFLALMLFMSVRLSFWVTVGIPIAFLGAIAALPMMGISINMISLFAFILVIGIVVDDAIIIGENVFRHQQQGSPGIKGAIKGAQEVSSPVFFAIATTIIAFAPIAFLPGAEGKLVYAIPVVVTLALLFSLVEAFLILPAHLSSKHAGSGQGFEDKIPLLSPMRAKIDGGLQVFIQKIYRPFLERALRLRYFSVAVFIGTLFIALALLANGWLRMTWIPEVDNDFVSVKATFSRSISSDDVYDGVKSLEQDALAIRDELEARYGQEQIVGVRTAHGTHGVEQGGHLGSIYIALTSSDKRKVTGPFLEQEIRKRASAIPGLVELKVQSSLMQGGAAVNIQLSGHDVEQLRQASDSLKDVLSGYDGLYQVMDSFEKGKEELRFDLKPVARDLGLTLETIASQVRQAFHGLHIQSVQRSGEEVSVVVRYPEESRSSLWHVENMSVRLPDGSSVPLLMVANVDYKDGPSQIFRNNAKRVIRVTASLDSSLTSTAEVFSALREDFLNDLAYHYPGVEWTPAGQLKLRGELQDYLGRAFLLALLCMYALMAVLFKSYSQPLMIMFAIPFGLVGAFLGHLVLGLDFTLWSIIGMMAVSGVVVNDNLVLVDYINRGRAQGVALKQAIRDAGAVRFRPILLTTLTTLGGLLPLMLETSLQAKFLIPMAVSLAFGVLFATTVSLILVPCVYHILEDLRSFFMGAREEHGVTHSPRSGSLGGHLASVTASVSGVLNKATQMAGQPSFGQAGGGSTNVDPQYQVSEQARVQAPIVQDAAPNRVTEPDSHSIPEDNDSGSASWAMSLDDAYEEGYKAGASGVHERLSPFDVEMLSASWEAGWDDGHDARTGRH